MGNIPLARVVKFSLFSYVLPLSYLMRIKYDIQLSFYWNRLSSVSLYKTSLIRTINFSSGT